MFPKNLSRVTKHAKPKHQLYQPGFNNFNSCWLKGDWITVPAEGFKKRAAEHKKLYAGIYKAQSHRDKGTALAKMTPAQKQAWEHFSGTSTLELRYPNGMVGGVRVDMAGKLPSAKSLAWIRSRHADGTGKVIPKILDHRGKVVDQSKLVPADMLSDDTEPVNIWKLTVQQNKARFKEFSKAAATISGFGPGVAVQHLFELEEQIIRSKIDPKPDPYSTPEEMVAEYVDHRKDMKEALGEAFHQAYDEAKESHNSCARTNLDNSEGRFYCYVLPKFNDDGTHEPWGPRDIPWAHYKPKKTA